MSIQTKRALRDRVPANRWAGRIVASVIGVVALVMAAETPANAQTNLLGLSGTDEQRVGYAISNSGSRINVTSVGNVPLSQRSGNLVGRFRDKSSRVLLTARKVRNNVFSFSSTTGGVTSKSTVTLSRPVGPLFYLLGDFDVQGDGISELAIVDASRNVYRWYIIEKPLSSDAREIQSFILGFPNDRIDWTVSRDSTVQFAALRQMPNTTRTRILLRDAESGQTSIYRSRWEDPQGLLTSVRLKRSYRGGPRLALYSPAKASVLLVGRRGHLTALKIPRKRCDGHMSVAEVSAASAVKTVELCPDGSYLIAERATTGGNDQDEVVSAGSLPEVIEQVQRGDLTRLADQIGEAPIIVPQPGTTGDQILTPSPERPANPAPAREPVATATSLPTLTETPTWTPTPSPTPTPTYTPTPIPAPFIFTIDTTNTSTGSSTNTQFRLPLIATGSYNFTVSWGDGTSDQITQHDQASITHTYATAGVYQVSMLGTCSGWRFNNSGDRLKMTTISQWGNGFRFGTTEGGYFYGCRNLNITATDAPILTGTTSLSQAFKECIVLNADLSTWDVSAVVDMSHMLEDAHMFNNGANTAVNPQTGRAGLDGWDVRSLDDAFKIFRWAYRFNRPLSNWNVSNLTRSQDMFFRAQAFDQDLSKWDMRKVTNMQSMFYGATIFNNGENSDVNPLTGRSGINGWDTSSAQNMICVFTEAALFNRPIGDWNTSAVTSIQCMFRHAASFNQDISSWNMSNVTNTSQMFSNAKRFNQNISSWNTSSVTTMSQMFQNARSFNQDLSPWNVSSVTSFNEMFSGAVSFRRNLSAWTPTSVTSFANMFALSDINPPGTTANYDNALLWLASSTAQNSLALSGGLARYGYAGLGSAALGTGRAHLTAALDANPTPGHAWTITDGGLAGCTFSDSGGLLATCSVDRPNLSRVVLQSDGTLPTGLSAGTTYWTVRVSSTTSRLATSLANAQTGTVVAFSDSGSGNHTMLDTGYVATAGSSSGALLLTLSTGGDLGFSGRKVRFASSGTLPTGISAGTDYWLNRVSATTYRVMTDVVSAADGITPIAFTDAGSGSHEILLQ